MTATVAWGGSLAYNGSSTIGMGFMQIGAADQFGKKYGIKFSSVSNDGTGKGLKALMEGSVHVAGASRPLKSEEIKQGLVATTIGYDAIAVFVNADNPVKELSKAQLKGIFTGRIRNWKEVGGKDAPIVPNTEILNGKRATIEMFQEMILDGEKYGAGFKQIDLPRDQIVEIAKQKNGIASASRGLLVATSAELRSKVKVIKVEGYNPTPSNARSGSYPISRSLFMVTAGEPLGEIKTFLDYVLSTDGQAIMKKNFVSVH
jgi:phosphate transport system substrate-binding protein